MGRKPGRRSIVGNAGPSTKDDWTPMLGGKGSALNHGYERSVTKEASR
jgi:hypothetical protein